MDVLRQIPIGQFAAPELEEQVGGGSWLRRLDPRLKLAWTVAFLVTPILAGPIWRLALVGLLLLITALSGLSWRLWRRSVPLLLALALLVGALAALLPAATVAPAALQRPPAELRLQPGPPGSTPREITCTLSGRRRNRYSAANGERTRLAVHMTTIRFTAVKSGTRRSNRRRSDQRLNTCVSMPESKSKGGAWRYGSAVSVP